MELGQRVSMHRGTIGAGGWLWYLGAVCGIGGIITLVRGVAALVGKGDVSLILNALLLVVIGIALLIVPVLRWQQSVEVFERGLVWTRLHGLTRVPREQVKSATWTKHISRNGSYDEIEVDLTTGKTLSMVGLAAPEQLCNFLRSWSQGAAAAPAQQSPGWQPPQNQPGQWSPGGWTPPRS